MGDLQVGTLSQALEQYPSLKGELGPRWAPEHDQVSPENDSNRLARWLRSPTASSILVTLDGIIGDIRAKRLDGVGAHFAKLRTEPDAFLDFATELYFMHWLLCHNYQFDLPAAGPDFTVHLPTGTELFIEATSPRKTEWTSELADRLGWLARRQGFRGELLYNTERLPDLDLARKDLIVSRSLDALVRAKRRPTGRRHVVQRYDKLDLRIVWRESEVPRFASRITGTGSAYTAFQPIATAAADKAKQLSTVDFVVLLVGTSNLESEAFGLIEVFRRASGPQLQSLNVELQDLWKRVPPSVGYICMYELSLNQTVPFRTTWITNPLCTHEEPHGMEHFRTEFSYRPGQDAKSRCISL